MRGKLALEEAVQAASVPHTILRATQFFEFIGRIADSSVNGGSVHLPPVLVQPEAADDVAAALADIALSEPVTASSSSQARSSSVSTSSRVGFSRQTTTGVR